jgi:hypothetical protein
MWSDTRTYVCIPCRFTSKYAGQCPGCRSTLLGMFNFLAPRKRDDRGWKKIELMVLVANSGIQLCTWSCCVPIQRPKKGRINNLTLSQYRARVRKQRTHRQGEVPRYYSFK